MCADLIAYDVHDLLCELFYDFFLIRGFVEWGRGDDLSGMGFIVTLCNRLAESKNDVGAGAIGQMGRSGGDRSGHTEEVNPDSSVGFCGILIEYKGGFPFIPEPGDEGSHGTLSRNDGHSGSLAQGIQLLVDPFVFCDCCHAGNVKAAQSAFEANEFPVSGMGGNNDVGFFLKVVSVGGYEALIFIDPCFGPHGKPENIDHGLGEARK